MGQDAPRVRQLYPRVGFIVTNLRRPAEHVVAFYNHRGTTEKWIEEPCPALLGFKKASRFPYTATSAIIGAEFGVIGGMSAEL